MRILITNDDGIEAAGIKLLERVARTLSRDVWVVAPEAEQSGASHSLTLTEPLRIRKLTTRKFAVRGTPTDSVMMAVNQLVPGKRPDLVLAGVNRGGNLGEDVTYSGTIAAAMEGTLLKLPSIALSQTMRFGHPVKWATAEQHAPVIIRRLLDVGWPAGVLINVNFPDVSHDAVAGIAVAAQGQRDLSDLVIDSRVDTRGVAYHWIGFRRQVGAPSPETDLAAVAQGRIAITPLQLNLTHHDVLENLRKGLM